MPSTRANPSPERLRQARLEKGLTQERVGEQAGLTFNSISRYENGAAFPSQLALNMLATIYDKPVEWFFGEEEQGAPPDAPTGLAVATQSTSPQTEPGAHPRQEPLEELLALVRETHRLLVEHVADRSSHHHRPFL